MSDFLSALERDLVAAMERYERTPVPLRVPRSQMRRLVPAAVVAGCLIAVVLAAGDFGGSRDERAFEAPAASLLPVGLHTREAGAYKLLVTSGSYQLLRCGDTDCGFDVFGEGLRGSEPRVRTGRVTATGGRVTFTRDRTCTRRGEAIAGVYEVTRTTGDLVRFRRLADPCAGRAEALTAAAWKLGR